MPLRDTFRFDDRWQGSVGALLGDVVGDHPRLGELLALLERRDILLEQWVNQPVIPPGARARASGAQAVANNTFTYLTWATEDYDTDKFHDTATNPSRLTIPFAGTYIVGFSVLFAAAGQTTSAWMEVNRGATRFGWPQTPNDPVNGTLLQGVDFLKLAAGNYVEVCAYQNSGAAVNVNNNPSCSFWIVRIGD